MSYEKHESLPLFLLSADLPLPYAQSFFNVIVHINQGADQLNTNTKLNIQSKALKSAHEEKTLNVLMNLMSLANVENDMQFYLIPYKYSDSLDLFYAVLY